MEKENKNVICLDKDGNKTEVKSSELSYRPSVYGIVLKGDEILLVPQWNGHDFPGGGMEIYETVEETLIREVWEETGYKVKPKNFVGCFDSFWTHPESGKHLHAILIYYVCEVVSGEISTKNLTDFEKQFGGKAEWLPLKELSNIIFRNSVDSKSLVEKAVLMG